MRATTSVTLLASLAACGGDDDPGSSTVTIAAGGASLVAARQVGEPWTVLTPDAAGTATYPVDDVFEVVAVCARQPTLERKVMAWRAAPADVTGAVDQFAASCFEPDVLATLTNALAHEVWVTARANGPAGFTSGPLAPGASAMFSLRAGTGDLVVEDRTAGTAGVIRGVTFVDGGTVTVRDVALAPLTSRPFSPTPAPGSVTSRLETAGGGALFEGTAGEALTVAPSVAQAGDRHLLVLDQRRQVDARRRVVDLDPASTAPVVLTPPPFVTSAALTGEPLLSATYQASGAWPQRTLTAASTAGVRWRAVLYPGAGDDDGAATAPDPSDLPGWDPAWSVTAAGLGSWDLALILSRTDATGRDEVSVEASWPPPT